MAMAQTLKNYLKQQHIDDYDVVTHPHALDSMHIAEAAHVPGDCLVKTVLLKDDRGFVMVLLPSTHRLELGKLHRQTRRELGLATESEVAQLFRDCDLGAIPPIGPAYGVETMLDDCLTERVDVYFEAGDHEELVHVSGRQFQQLLGDIRHGRFSHHV